MILLSVTVLEVHYVIWLTKHPEFVDLRIFKTRYQIPVEFIHKKKWIILLPVFNIKLSHTAFKMFTWILCRNLAVTKLYCQLPRRAAEKGCLSMFLSHTLYNGGSVLLARPEAFSDCRACRLHGPPIWTSPSLNHMGTVHYRKWSSGKERCVSLSAPSC